MRRFVSAIIVLLCGSAFSHAAAFDNPRERIKVFCFAAADASGFVDARSQARMDSLKDLQENIQKKHNDRLELVTRREDADIVVEVLDRSLEKNGRVTGGSTRTTTKDGQTSSTTSRATEPSDYVVKTMMSVGTYKNPLNGSVNDEFLLGGLWKTAAGDVGNQLDTWVKTNYEKVLGARSARK